MSTVIAFEDRFGENWDSPDWGSLMVSAQGGDREAYRQLLGQIAVWFREYFSLRLPVSSIEEATRDAMFAVHQKRHTYEQGRSFEVWLEAIARYKCSERLRREERTGPGWRARVAIAVRPTGVRRSPHGGHPG
jgi:DNA-directed RNA polymerase specialized sigma24 family protein